MLEKVDLSISADRESYDAQMGPLQNRLYDLQKACWDARIPTMIVFEGWDTAGKGSTINLLTRRLDSRGFKLHAVQAARTHELHMPWLWRFWLKVPNYGEMAIFDRSWYGRVLVERVEGLTPEPAWRQAYMDIVGFERALNEDGYLLIKFFLHISKKEQAHRFKKLQKDPLQNFLVTAEDMHHHDLYKEYYLATEEMLERTDTEWAPWTIVEATDKRWTRLKVFQTLVNQLEAALTARGKALPPAPPMPGASAVAAAAALSVSAGKAG